MLTGSRRIQRVSVSARAQPASSACGAHCFFLKGRGKRLATPKYIRLESKEMEDTKPENRRGEGKKEKIKGEEQKPTRPDQQDLSY
jgi:hypothetical protein